ncbi:ABC transporter permease [Clostridium tarantellae]|uniref:FtsX-like permease family protein n=1 Tax=Clostridium tarantellae TaxID=39493 RepID=A0A6I1MK57_9CLOT|nr:ABC transporter permease [Clostridium tarantellae]MPQ43344.1 FtsX-like permease family protein [Clostridium tarantellae]
MYFKLALNNVKKSFKDYTIYFLTLTFAVCIFYSFNSLGSQQAMLSLSKNQGNMLDMLTNIMSALSIFVSVVLAFLIIYANNFLIRKRKKELGIYMILGMSKRKISSILLCETLIIGFASLIVGLLLGIALSQVLSIITAKLFVLNIEKYTFVFSVDATLKTLLYFGIIFIVVMLFNTLVISKYKLIDLLNARKKSENLKIKNAYVSVILFIISIISLGVAYNIILKNGLTSPSPFLISIVLGCIGTLLFFMSLSGFILKVVQSNKKIYLKNLNMFILRQINSKINTAYISMTIICLMLFFTIAMLSSGFSFKYALEYNLKSHTPFDASIYTYTEKINNPNAIDLKYVLKESGLNLDDYSNRYNTITKYDSDINTKNFLLEYADPKFKNQFDSMYADSAKIISINDLNNNLKLQGKKTYTLNDNETMLICNFDIFKSTLENFILQTNNITLNNENYKIKDKKVYNFSLMTTMTSTPDIIFVVPKNHTKNLPISETILNINFNDNVNLNTIEKNLEPILYKHININNNEIFLIGLTRELIYIQNNGLSTLVIYIGIYLGLIFLLTSAAVLALQQLSEAADNSYRYSILRKIGVSKKMINKSILIQIFIYFMLPLSLAIIHSIIGINVASDVINIFGGSYDILIPSLITALIICIIYGGYFIATYVGCKNMIKDNK